MQPTRLLSTLVALLVLGVSTAGALAAQSIPSPYRFIEERQEIGVFAGLFHGDAGQYGFGPGPGPMSGIRYGLELTGPLGLEALASFVPTTRDVINPGREEGDRKVEEAEVALVLFEARLRFALTGRRTWHGFQPFAFIGAGLGFDAQGDQSEDLVIPPDDRFDFGTRFQASGGGGVRFLLGRRWVLRADAALLLYELQTPSGFFDEDRDLGVVPEKEWVNSTTVTLGFAFRF